MTSTPESTLDDESAAEVCPPDEGTSPGPAESPAPATSFPVVGVGASAGGLAAFESFFAGMPADRDPGMAFVLVQHLAPDHKSILSELIRRYTRMQVFEVEDGKKVCINCAYIIPPNYDMAFLNGTLHLLEPVSPRGQRLPIDFLFKSLADDQRELAIAIILSGTGCDGTLGARAIKHAGGMVMAQLPSTCEFDGMPCSAISAGQVDYQLAPDAMAAQLMAYAANMQGRFPRTGNPVMPAVGNALKKIFLLLRTVTGHDFSQYKPNTVYRRIERRMLVNQLDSIDVYVRYLQNTPGEAESLFRDLLIGVTSFFRDPEAFEVLEKAIIPKLFEGKPAGAAVRVWSTGCSTGEEAYSLAILLSERMDKLKQNYAIQVFATDIDSRAIATARAGLYPASIAPDISPERLARYFSLEPGGQTYRIHKRLRDLLVFSEQDLIKDPPFSRLDLISCRNLLIYLDANLQKKLIPLFHYALKPHGMLFLGNSEGIGEFDNLFAVHDRKAKLYVRKEDQLYPQRSSVIRSMPIMSGSESGVSKGPALKSGMVHKLPLRELVEKALLKHLAPASALVNGAGDILYLHGRTGMYLEPSGGEAGVQNIVKMAREGLRHNLSNALHQCIAAQIPIVSPHLRVKTNGQFSLVKLSVYPVNPGSSYQDSSEHLYLVMLQDVPNPPEPIPPLLSDPQACTDVPSDVHARIEALSHELRAKDEYLQSTHEELESSNEELRSSNEEMQSVNEELQSANEELETSKEELQSVNEELATVNTELQTKVSDLSRANDDMNNLLAGTGVGTVFVDFQLHILRFTPAASTIINLIASDVGRPVAHIASNLRDYPTLVADIKEVLQTLIPKEVEVCTQERLWYTLRIKPYRTLNNVIEGAVISFIEITEIVKTRSMMEKSRQGLRNIIDLTPEMIWLTAVDGRLLMVNQKMASHYNLSVDAMVGRRHAEIHPDESEVARMLRDHRTVAASGEAMYQGEETFHTPTQTLILQTTRIPINHPESDEPAILVIGVDITQRKQVEHQLNQTLKRLTLATRAGGVGLWRWDVAENTLVWDQQMHQLYGMAVGSFAGDYDAWLERIHPDDRAACDQIIKRALETRKDCELEYRIFSSGQTVRNLRSLCRLEPDAQGQLHMFGSCSDITMLRQARKQEQATWLHASPEGDGPIPARNFLNDAPDALILQDLEGRTLAWNTGAERLYGWSEAQALNMTLFERTPESLREEALPALIKLSSARLLKPMVTQRLTQSGVEVDVSIISSPLFNENKQFYGILTTERALEEH